MVVTQFPPFFRLRWMTLISILGLGALGLLQIYLHLVVFMLLLSHNIVMMLKRTWKGLINDHESWWHPDRRKTEDEMVFICGSRIDHFARIAAHFSLQFTISAARTLQLTEREQLLFGSISHQLKIIQWHNSWMNLFSMIVYTHTINIVNRKNYSELLPSDYSPKDVRVFPLEALCCCSAAVLHAGRYLHQRMEHQCALLWLQ